MPRLLLLACLTLFASSALAQTDDDDPRYRRNLAPATNSVVLTPDGKPDRLEFSFGRTGGSAWLAAQGELYIDTWVQHRGLLCGTYEVGIRFGQGERGCTDVEWLAPAHWLTSHRQCNNALMHHVGSDIDPHMTPLYGRITCAQRLVRCTGSCR